MDLLNLYVKIFPFKVSLILSWFVLFEDCRKKPKSRITGLLARVSYLGLRYILWTLYTVFPSTISTPLNRTFVQVVYGPRDEQSLANLLIPLWAGRASPLRD